MSIKRLNQLGFDHVFLAVACFVLAGVIGTAFVVASHAATTTATVQWTGRLEPFKNLSGYCLTTVSSTYAASGAEGAYGVLEACKSTYTSNQVWSVVDTRTINIPGEGLNYATANGFQEFEIQSAAGSSECLNDWQSNGNNGVQMRLYPCSTTAPANAWVWESKVYNANPHQLMNLAASDIAITGGRVKKSTGSWPDNMCLDDAYGSEKTNNKVQTYSCKNPNQGPANQEWFEDAAPAKTVTSSSWTGALQNGYDRKLCMNDNNSSTKTGTAIGIYTCSTAVSEKWTIAKNSAGQFYLKNGQGVCAFASGSGATEVVQTNTCSSATLFEWNGNELEDATSKTCINDPSSSTVNSTQLHIAACSTAASEQWYEAVQ